MGFTIFNLLYYKGVDIIVLQR